MLTIYNGGYAGRDYSRMEWTSIGEDLLVIFFDENAAIQGTVVLRRDTVRTLRDALTRWLGEAPPAAEPPFIEGSL